MTYFKRNIYVYRPIIVVINTVSISQYEVPEAMNNVKNAKMQYCGYSFLNLGNPRRVFQNLEGFNFLKLNCPNHVGEPRYPLHFKMYF